MCPKSKLAGNFKSKKTNAASKQDKGKAPMREDKDGAGAPKT